MKENEHLYIPSSQTFAYSPKLQIYLCGRSLLLEEIPFSKKDIHMHIKHNYIRREQAMIRSKQGWQCMRCGNKAAHRIASFPCERCNEECVYCRHCLTMGRVTSCSSLYRWIGPHPPRPTCNLPMYSESSIPNSKDVKQADHTSLTDTSFFTWEGMLSESQRLASVAIEKAIAKKEEYLVWAVCGAGKTEMLFNGIKKALLQCLRVCVATPRTDVVLELAPRLQRVFPTTVVSVLHGGSEDCHPYALLTISTTHQLLRFTHAFDVMIIDEVDAFPFSYDNSLQYAAKKATKKEAAIIYLTATPSRKWQNECLTGKRKYIKIPARYHRHPLPVPTLKWCGNWQKSLRKNQLPINIRKWTISQLEKKRQALIFFPTIEWLHHVLPLFQRLHRDIKSVHADDPDRLDKLQRMRKKQLPILLTTTILERGVTFSPLDVAVVGSEDDIFTEAALVQIAGRVGRSASDPDGNVTFFHFGRTKAINNAIKHIVQMNRLAKKLGLIDQFPQ